jgi:hypothetical protein
MSIGANSKPIFQPWEQIQQKTQPAFNFIVKLLGGTQGFHQKIGLQNVALFGQNFTPPAGIVNANKKIPGLLTGKGK